jgi:hypothetical protein
MRVHSNVSLHQGSSRFALRREEEDEKQFELNYRDTGIVYDKSDFDEFTEKFSFPDHEKEAPDTNNSF